ncbi:MEKHLA domain-containing protein [Altericista sp. CCNU0014]|uniref:MEKHLA domain-containing protein n=1 Tax=Altericista sp. CCNU0014 TaxID=3082949 RepID=UPI00384FEC22
MLYPWQTAAAISHAQYLLTSFHHWLGRDLLPDCSADPAIAAHQLFGAPFAVLSHGTEPDPILNYGNQTALDLWETDWLDFTQMPSRLTAEPDLREGRSQLLATAAQQGYLTGYEGVRISKTGQRFLIEQAIVWRVLDDKGNGCGQAATFDRWKPLA